jgi:hypothetical protein
MSNNKQTNIIDDLDAIALAQQCGKRRALPKKKKEKAGGVGPSAQPVTNRSKKPKPAKKSLGVLQNAGASAPPVTNSSTAKSAKQAAAPQCTGSQFYEEHGVKIPLHDKSGRKRVRARLSNSLRNKNTELLLDGVNDYAGADKRKKFKDVEKTKTEKADWIIGHHETYAMDLERKSQQNITSKS